MLEFEKLQVAKQTALEKTGERLESDRRAGLSAGEREEIDVKDRLYRNPDEQRLHERRLHALKWNGVRNCERRSEKARGRGDETVHQGIQVQRPAAPNEKERAGVGGRHELERRDESTDYESEEGGGGGGSHRIA